MDLQNQFLAGINILIRPKRTLIDLPSDKFYIVGFFISAYFSIANVSRNGGLTYLVNSLNSKLAAYMVYLLLCGIFYIIFAFIVRLIILIFGKRLTLNKVMSIIGYSQTPRLVLSLPLSILLAILPASSRLELLFSIPDGGVATILMIITSIIGGLLLFYSIFLLFWGFVLSGKNEEIITE